MRTPDDTMNRKSLALECGLIFLVLFVPLQHLFDASIFTIFQARDLDRARLLSTGHLILFGPELSGGSHLPGGFYYFLLAIPLKLGFGWKAVWQLQMASMAAAISALWLFTRRRFGIFPACYALLCAAAFDFKNLLSCNNASFLPIFAVGSLISLCHAFDESSSNRGLAWGLFCLFGGLGLQLHMTFLLLFLSGAIIQLSAPRLGLRPLGGRAFIAGLAIFLATMAPFLIWLASNALSSPLGQACPPFTTGDHGLHANEFALMLVHGEQKTRTLIRHFMLLIPFEAIFPLLLLGGSALTRKPSDWLESPDGSDRHRFAGSCVKVLSVTSAMTFPSYAFSLALTPTRYAMVSRLSLDLLICAVLARRAARLRQTSFYPALIALFLAFTWAAHPGFRHAGRAPLDASRFLFPALAGGALALLVRREADAKAGRALLPAALVLPLILSMTIDSYAGGDSSRPGIKDLEAMSRAVHSQTGWTYEEAKRRIFYVDMPTTISPAYVYRTVEREERGSPLPGPAGLDRIDGYFAVLLKRPQTGAADAKTLLSSAEIAATPMAGISSGAILLGNPIASGRLRVIPYKVKDTERFPPFFHNGSEAYSFDAPASDDHPGAKTSRFLFNDCPGRPDWCAIAAEVRMGPEKRGRRTVDVVLKGDPISQASEWVSLDWVQSLERPYFTASCAGVERRVLLAESVGPIPDGHMTMNRSMLAPYERSFHVDCDGPIENVSVGYEYSLAYALGKPVEPRVPGRRLFAPH